FHNTVQIFKDALYCVVTIVDANANFRAEGSFPSNEELALNCNGFYHHALEPIPCSLPRHVCGRGKAFVRLAVLISIHNKEFCRSVSADAVRWNVHVESYKLLRSRCNHVKSICDLIIRL